MDEAERTPETPPEPAASAPVAEPTPMSDLQAELDRARTQAAEYLDGWQRARAEFTNYRRRVEKEQAEVHQAAAGRVIARYLEVLDDFERALRDQPAGEAGVEALAQWASGVTLIYRKLQAILEAEGVTRVQAEGQAFDPSLHEAITHEDSAEHASGQVIAVLRQGYKLGERVLRPALVRVAK